MHTQVYGGAAAAYAALADHLRGTAGKGHYFFGAEPCSLDAAIFAHLALHHSAPVSAPELRQKVHGRPQLLQAVGLAVAGIAARCMLLTDAYEVGRNVSCAARGTPHLGGLCGAHQQRGVLAATPSRAAHHIGGVGAACRECVFFTRGVYPYHHADACLSSFHVHECVSAVHIIAVETMAACLEFGHGLPLRGLPCTREKKELSARDKEWRRGNQIWLAGAGAAILAYCLLSGQYIQFSLGGEYDEDAEEDE